MNTSYIQGEKAAHLATFPARTAQNARLPLSECLDTDIERLRRNLDLFDAQGQRLHGCEQAAVDALAALYRLTPRQAWGFWIRHAATLDPR